MSSKELSRIIAETWKEMTNQQRQKYLKMYDQDKERYQQELEVFNLDNDQSLNDPNLESLSLFASNDAGSTLSTTNNNFNLLEELDKILKVEPRAKVVRKNKQTVSCLNPCKEKQNHSLSVPIYGNRKVGRVIEDSENTLASFDSHIQIGIKQERQSMQLKIPKY